MLAYYNIIGTRVKKSIRMLLLSILLLLSVTAVEAQIVIGGSVYGGGNEGNVGGSTSVTVRAGDINKVYGGARMANIAGNAFVNIDGENASNYILINYVYGGNDIAGTIGTNLKTFALPTALTRTSTCMIRKGSPAMESLESTSGTMAATGAPACPQASSPR